MHTRKEQMEAFGRFLDILDELREKCPWDRKQTNESLRPNTIEETYELCDALIRDDKSDICKELGDVLLHVAFYAKIGSETGDFDMKDVCDRLCEKLIFRHPHVFGDVKAETAGQVSENWELPDFFFYLIPHLFAFFPVESYIACLVLDAVGLDERG